MTLISGTRFPTNREEPLTAMSRPRRRQRPMAGIALKRLYKPTMMTERVSGVGAQENVEVVRRGYEAFNAGDMATLADLFAEDAVWYAAGSGVLSGMKQGRDEILAYFGELGSRSQGSFQAEVQDIVGGENHTVGIQRSHAKNNGKTLDSATAIAFVLRDGKVAEGREYFDDTAKADDFWT